MTNANLRHDSNSSRNQSRQETIQTREVRSGGRFISRHRHSADSGATTDCLWFLLAFSCSFSAARRFRDGSTITKSFRSISSRESGFLNTCGVGRSARQSSRIGKASFCKWVCMSSSHPFSFNEGPPNQTIQTEATNMRALPVIPNTRRSPREKEA